MNISPVPKMAFLPAVRRVYRKLWVLQGRSSRSEFWWYILFEIIVGGGILATQQMLMLTMGVDLNDGSLLSINETLSQSGVLLFQCLFQIMILCLQLPKFAVTVRRLHDIGHSGWSLLWTVIPLIGPVLLLCWTLRPGIPEVNRFGTPWYETTNDPSTSPMIQTFSYATIVVLVIGWSLGLTWFVRALNV